MMRKALLVAASVAALAVVPVAAAHVEPTQSTAPAGGYPVIGFNVPHGCDGAPRGRSRSRSRAGSRT